MKTREAKTEAQCRKISDRVNLCDRRLLVLFACMNSFDAHINPRREVLFSSCFLYLIPTGQTILTRARTWSILLSLSPELRLQLSRKYSP